VTPALVSEMFSKCQPIYNEVVSKIHTAIDKRMDQACEKIMLASIKACNLSKSKNTLNHTFSLLGMSTSPLNDAHKQINQIKPDIRALLKTAGADIKKQVNSCHPNLSAQDRKSLFTQTEYSCKQNAGTNLRHELGQDHLIRAESTNSTVMSLTKAKTGYSDGLNLSSEATYSLETDLTKKI